MNNLLFWFGLCAVFTLDPEVALSKLFLLSLELFSSKQRNVWITI